MPDQKKKKEVIKITLPTITVRPGDGQKKKKKKKQRAYTKLLNARNKSLLKVVKKKLGKPKKQGY